MNKIYILVILISSCTKFSTLKLKYKDESLGLTKKSVVLIEGNSRKCIDIATKSLKRFDSKIKIPENNRDFFKQHYGETHIFKCDYRVSITDKKCDGKSCFNIFIDIDINLLSNEREILNRTDYRFSKTVSSIENVNDFILKDIVEYVSNDLSVKSYSSFKEYTFDWRRNQKEKGISLERELLDKVLERKKGIKQEILQSHLSSNSKDELLTLVNILQTKEVLGVEINE